jgi:hypothetical protein
MLSLNQHFIETVYQATLHRVKIFCLYCPAIGLCVTIFTDVYKEYSASIFRVQGTETLVNTYQATRLHIPEDNELYTHRYGNLDNDLPDCSASHTRRS